MPNFISGLENSLLLAAGIPRFYYAIPLIIAISLVYGATRHEHLKEIFAHAFKSALWIGGFMGIIYVIIFLIGYWN